MTSSLSRGGPLLAVLAATAVLAVATPGGGISIPGLGDDSVDCSTSPSLPGAGSTCNHHGNNGGDGRPGAVHHRTGEDGDADGDGTDVHGLPDSPHGSDPEA